MALEEIRARVRTCLYELETDSRLLRSGLKAEAESATILDRYQDLQSLSTLDSLHRLGEQAPTPEERERIRRLYFACLSFHLYRHVALLNDELDTRLARTEVLIDGHRVNYFDLPLRIEREDSAIGREELDGKRLRVVEDTNALRARILGEVLACLKGHLGYGGYLEYCREKKQVEYERLAVSLDAAFAELEELYRRHMGRWLASHHLGELGRTRECHARYLLSLRPLDKGGEFPLEGIVRRALEAVGLSLSSFPNIHLDLEERPRKNPRACCYSPAVPEEIHLITKPTGSLADFNTFFHESGHAFHYACTQGTLPFEFKQLAPSYALTETYAFLLQNLTCEPSWLRTFLGVNESEARRISYYTVLSDLYLFMRYTAKFSYELTLFRQRGPAPAAARTLYAEVLSKRTGFLYNAADFLDDVDEEFYSADYLRAWLSERQLAHYLRREVGEHWTSSPRTGDALRALWSRGDRDEVEDLLKSLGFSPGDAAPLVSWYRDFLEG